MRLALAAGLLLLGLLSGAQAQPMHCPAGTHPWVDGWGNATCRSFETDQDVITSPNRATGIPNGAVRSMDAWGNRTARGSGPTEDTTYYDLSKGCPRGTHPWPDQ